MPDELTAEEVETRKKAIETGAVVLHSVAELGEQFAGYLPETLGVLAEWAGPLSSIIGVLEMIYHTIHDMGTEERGAGFRGTAYGTVWAALDLGTPTHTCHGSDGGDSQDKLDTEAWNKGAHEAAAKISGDHVARNRVVIHVARDGDPGKTLNAIFQELCAKSGDHLLAEAYSHLPWPGPQ